MEIDIQKLKQKDLQAFEDFVHAYEKKIYNIAFRMSKDASLACDISQDVFMKVYSSFPNFKEDSSLSTWIYRITMNACIDYQRRRKRENTISIVQSNADEEEFVFEIPDSSHAPERCYDTTEMMDQIASALQELSADHRAIVVLKDIEQKSYQEISEILQCNEGTVKSRLFRAREQLRTILNRNGNFFAEYMSNK